MIFILFLISFGFWILSCFILIYACVYSWKNEKFLPFLLCYVIIFFPIFIRMYNYIIYETKELQNIWISVFLLFVFIIVFLFYLNKFLKKTKEHKIYKNFSIIYLNTLQKIFDFLICYNFMRLIFCNTLTFLTNYVNTINKKLCFFICFNFLPRIIFFFALFWDININQQIYYSLRCSLLLIIPIVCHIYLVLLYFFSKYTIDTFCSLFFITQIEKESENTENNENIQVVFKGSNISEKCIYEISLIRPPRYYDLQNYLNTTWYDWLKSLGWLPWCEETNELLEPIIKKMTLVFLFIQILCQISYIIQYI